MPSWWDSLFGDVPQPARPTSRGAMLGMGGYQNMPDATAGIEDRRQADFPHTYVSSRPHDLNWESRNNYNKFDPGSFSAYFADEQARRRDAQHWLSSNMPRIPMTPMQDPDFTLDPSIVARQRAWEDQMARSYPPGWQGPSLPDGSERGPQFSNVLGTTLNSVRGP